VKEAPNAIQEKSIKLAGDHTDVDQIFAILYFPNDPILREQYFTHRLAEKALEGEPSADSFPINRYALHLLIDAPSHAEFKKLATEATKRGNVAGDLLLSVDEQVRYGVPEPSLNKAIKRYKQFAIGNKYGDGDALKYSEQTIRDYWKECQPAAHLWGAFRAAQMLYGKNVFSNANNFQKFLGMAKGLQEFVLTHTASRDKAARKLIEPEILMALPTHIEALRMPIVPDFVDAVKNAYTNL
jgi:hypothetical protein